MTNIRESASPDSNGYGSEVEKASKAPYIEQIPTPGSRVTGRNGELVRELKSRHMQMIAFGGSIGAGLLVGSGAAFHAGGPGSVLVCFLIIGVMLVLTMQGLAELAVLYPVNGAFYTYTVRFVDKSWGFAMGWEYAINWLIVLPFELTTAAITIQFWRTDISSAIWITIFLAVLVFIQVFGVRGYGEVEFILSMLKILAICGFIIFAIIVDCGGVPTDPRGYIGGRYWHDPGAFMNGFKGFCAVFVNAAFAFGGTELVGLAAAEAADPRRSLPKATKQVLARISFFYIVTLFLIGLIIPSNDPHLLGSSGGDTKASPFVLAIEMARVKALPSIFNAVITVSVISVANSCTYASSRTMQALALHKMGPSFLQYIDRKGRPVWCLVVQLAIGGIAYISEAGVGQEVFNWLLSLSSLASLIVWGSINLSHIRFRAGWKASGFTVGQLPYRAAFGVCGSYFGLALNVICIMAVFYTSLFPLGSDPNAKAFFESFLAGPIAIALYAFWKIWSRDWTWYIKAEDMDVMSGMREGSLQASDEPPQSWAKRIWTTLF